MTLYVDTAGNDVSGRGTAASPYASVTRAMRAVPKIAHPVNIVVTDSIGAMPFPLGAWPQTIDNEIIDGGSLTIYGKGAPTRKTVDGGPHTVTAVADIGSNAQRVTIGGAAFTPDDFCGYWLRVVTGGHVDRTWPVYGNAATTICIPQDNTGDKVHNGDTVEIIYPSIVFAVDNMDIAYLPRSALTNVAGGYGKFTLANLRFDASASTNWTQFVVGSDVGAADTTIMEFVSMEGLDYGAIFYNVGLNMYTAYDTTYVADCDADILNMGEGIDGPGLSLYTSSVRAGGGLAQYSGALYSIAVAGVLRLYDPNPAFFGGCAAVETFCYSSSVYAWLAGVDNATPAVSLSIGDFQLKINVEGDCNYAVDAAHTCTVYFHSGNSCSPTLTALSALRVGTLAQVMIHDAMANFLGATAGQEAYVFVEDAAVKSATWPAAHTLVTDAHGANLVRST